MRIWLTAVEESQFLAAASRADVLDGLAGLGVASAAPLPSDALPRAAAGALAVGDVAALHRLLHRAFQLSRTLPDALLHDFHRETANLPRTTEAERQIIRRVGQDIFRRSAMARLSSVREKKVRWRSAARIQRSTSRTATSALALSRGRRTRAGMTTKP